MSLSLLLRTRVSFLWGAWKAWREILKDKEGERKRARNIERAARMLLPPSARRSQTDVLAACGERLQKTRRNKASFSNRNASTFSICE